MVVWFRYEGVDVEYLMGGQVVWMVLGFLLIDSGKIMVCDV